MEIGRTKKIVFQSGGVGNEHWGVRSESWGLYVVWTEIIMPAVIVDQFTLQSGWIFFNTPGIQR